MTAPLLLMRVAAAWSLPGLGLLVLPEGPTPHLLPYALHAALAVEAVLPDSSRHAATATVEEVTRPEEPTVVAQSLLLDFNGPTDIPAGTEIWLAEPRR
ncbi:MAG: hypothetical protein JWR44_30 [Hymenobacter sp.]|nr:hypothetical protein [Hymenobacter sp.]